MKFVLIAAPLLLAAGLLSAQSPLLYPPATPSQGTPAGAPGPMAHAAAPQKAIVSPFQEDEELQSVKDAKRLAIQTAVAPIKVLARGIQKDKAVALLALDNTRRIMLAKGDTLTLATASGAVEIKLVSLTRQTLSFQLEDGTLLPIQ